MNTTRWHKRKEVNPHSTSTPRLNSKLSKETGQPRRLKRACRSRSFSFISLTTSLLCCHSPPIPPVTVVHALLSSSLLIFSPLSKKANSAALHVCLPLEVVGPGTWRAKLTLRETSCATAEVASWRGGRRVSAMVSLCEADVEGRTI